MNLPSPLRRRSLFVLLSLSIVVPFVVAASQSVSAARPDAEVENDSLYKYLTVFTEVLGLVRNSYVEATDAEVLMASALDGTVDALDPFALFVPAPAAERFLAAAEAGSSRSGLRLAREHGVVFVATVEDGSPAAAAEIAAGDILSKVDGASSRQLPLWEVETRFAGAPGTKVETEWIRRGEIRKATLELAAFAPTAPSLTEQRGVPVLHLARLDATTAGKVRELLAPLAGRTPARLVLDVRGAAGSEARFAYEVAGLFADGDFGLLKARDKTLETFVDRAPDVFRGEIAVLVDRSTIGPAELLAGVLRQRAGARLVGERSFGYAGREQTLALSGGARLRLATAFYTAPDGKPIATGLSPDLPVDESTRRFGDKDVPLGELVLRKGIGLLLGEEHLPVEKKAA